MNRSLQLTLLATLAWLACFFLLVRLFGVSGPNPYRTEIAVGLAVLLIAAGWLTGKAIRFRNRQ